MENKCLNCGNILEEGQEFCPKCGQKAGVGISKELNTAINDFNKNVGKKKKKGKKAGLIILIILAVLFVGIVIYELAINGWSPDNFRKVLVSGHYSCLIEHNFEEANCLHGKKCKECEYEIGEAIDHTWVEANCTEPKHCTTCGKTEGRANGHSVGIGTCSICGEYSTDLVSELLSIRTTINKALEELADAAEDLSDASDSYYLKDTYVKYAKEDLQDAKDYLQDAIDLCGSYSELSSLKTKLTSAKSAINTSSSYTYTLSNGVLDSYEYILEADKIISGLVSD